jgi:hypothetical protein
LGVDQFGHVYGIIHAGAFGGRNRGTVAKGGRNENPLVPRAGCLERLVAASRSRIPVIIDGRAPWGSVPGCRDSGYPEPLLMQIDLGRRATGCQLPHKNALVPVSIRTGIGE